MGNRRGNAEEEKGEKCVCVRAIKGLLRQPIYSTTLPHTLKTPLKPPCSKTDLKRSPQLLREKGRNARTLKKGVPGVERREKAPHPHSTQPLTGINRLSLPHRAYAYWKRVSRVCIKTEAKEAKPPTNNRNTVISRDGLSYCMLCSRKSLNCSSCCWTGKGMRMAVTCAAPSVM